jgi:hypothetical protein
MASTTDIINAVIHKTNLLAQGISSFYFMNLTTIEIISVILSLIFIGISIFFIIKTGWLTLRYDRIKDVVLKKDVPKKQIKKEWQKIEEHFFEGGENDLKIAIIKADNLLDEALRYGGITGKTLGDRLKKIKSSQLTDIDLVWQAHKLRNEIAHEKDFKLKRDLAEKTLGIYEKTLHELKILE